MKLNGKLIGTLLLPALLLTGCSGISASHSVSPLDFFMPGIGSFLYVPPAAAPSPTTAPVALKPAVTLDHPLAQAN